MLRSTIISSLIVLFFGQFLIAQDIDLDIKRTVYNRYNIVGAQANTNGFGAMYRYGKRITGFKNHLFTATVANFKYAKEEKFYSSVVNSKRLSSMDKNHKGGLASSLDKLEKVGAVLPLPTPNLHVLHFCTSQ